MSSGIEWTDETWNPVTGCDKVSRGCDNCYALRQAKRLKAMGSPRYQKDGDPRTSGPGFGVTCHEDALTKPFRWKTPRRIFVNSMSDLFHPDVPDEFIGSVFSVMARAPQHTFMVLTKRPKRMRDLLTKWVEKGSFRDQQKQWVQPATMPLPNVWIGVSIESDQYCFRADLLRETPAAVRFLSLEPLLSALPSLDLAGIDWVIAGGESGPKARPMHPDWVRDIRDQCITADIPFFFKQWGEYCPVRVVAEPHRCVLLGHDGTVLPHTSDEDIPADRVMMVREGKSRAGSILDNVVWEERPGWQYRVDRRINHEFRNMESCNRMR